MSRRIPSDVTMIEAQWELASLEPGTKIWPMHAEPGKIGVGDCHAGRIKRKFVQKRLIPQSLKFSDFRVYTFDARKQLLLLPSHRIKHLPESILLAFGERSHFLGSVEPLLVRSVKL